MGHPITLNLPEQAWQDLLRAGRERNEDPAAVAQQLLADAVADPVLRLAGCLSFPPGDLSERHDEYIGAAIYAESREK